MNDWCGPKMNYTNSMDKFVAISCSCDRLQSNLMTSRGFVRIYNIYLLQTYWVSINSGPSSLLHRYTDKYIKCWPQNLCRYLILLQNSNVDTGMAELILKRACLHWYLNTIFAKLLFLLLIKGMQRWMPWFKIRWCVKGWHRHQTRDTRWSCRVTGCV